MPRVCCLTGNRYFSKNSFISATECYTASIRCAPVEPPPPPPPPPTAPPTTLTSEQQTDNDNDAGGEQHELPLAYANRSAALLRLRRFQLCIRDTELAIEHGFPKESQYKLYDRRGKAYAEMSCQENAIENFKIARELLDVSDLQDKVKVKWQKEIDQQLEKCYAINKALIRPRMDSARFHTAEFFNYVGLSPQELVLFYTILEIGVCQEDLPVPM